MGVGNNHGRWRVFRGKATKKSYGPSGFYAFRGKLLQLHLKLIFNSLFIPPESGFDAFR
jgi:hypothetical protein